MNVLTLDRPQYLTERILCVKVPVEYMGEEAYAWVFRPVEVSAFFGFAFSPNWPTILASDPIELFLSDMFKMLDETTETAVVAKLELEYKSGTSHKPDLSDLIDGLSVDAHDWWIGSYAEKPYDYVCVRVVGVTLEDAIEG